MISRDEIWQILQLSGLKQGPFGDALGVSQATVSRWLRAYNPQKPDPAAEEALRTLRANLLSSGVQENEDAAEKRSAADEAPPRSAEENAKLRPDQQPVDIARFKGPRNVPVYGAAAGGIGGDFRLNGRIIDHAPRPPGIASRLDVFVVYVVGDSVSPKYEDGDPIYVDPHRRPAPRDYVFVELWGVSEDEPGDALIKRLIGRRGGNLLLEQHNPAGPLDPIPEEAVKRVHRVIPWRELLGI